MDKSLKSTSKYRCLKIIISIILITAIPVLLIVVGNNIESQEQQKDSINFLLTEVIKDNPELAIASGVRGFVEIGYADLPGSGSTFAASRGERVTIPIFISFTSYDPNLKSLDILIDPSREDIGMRTWQYWYEYNSEGKEINRGEIYINDLISYDEEGIVTIEDGYRVEFNMFVDIPSDLPPLETGSIMLVAAGIGLEHEERGVGLSDRIGGKELTLN